jgi:hypothetical protein
MSNMETIREFLDLVKPIGEVFELRTTQADGERKTRYHGTYNDHDQAARDAEDFGGDCYFTVKHIDQRIPARNELVRCKKNGNRSHPGIQFSTN